MAKSKYSADERAWALESGDYQIYKSARLQLLKDDHIEFLHSSEYFAHLNLCDYDVCRCLWRAESARTHRLRKRLAPMIMEGAWFLTLTFDDLHLASTTPETRRVYVRKFLKSNFLHFVANKDFGRDFGREHYHAVVSMPFDLAVFALVHDANGCHSKLDGWICGFSNWEKVGRLGTGEDLKHVSRYLAKLQNHALKETASKDERMIFSRR